MSAPARAGAAPAVPASRAPAHAAAGHRTRRPYRGFVGMECLLRAALHGEGGGGRTRLPYDGLTPAGVDRVGD
ncbi:hypothetical protein GCM10010300_26330 [Streptomyces olivaceoviridis]|nr:hypothetical protein GCM10010300_26330 [Streptomyces olivaceoviridis]